MVQPLSRLCLPLICCLALASAADARFQFPRATGGAATGNTIAPAAFATSAEVGQFEQVTLAWGGASAPTAIASATWSGTGSCAGSATPTGAFIHTGNLVQQFVSVPPGAGVCNLAITDNRGASTTITGVTITAPGNDLTQFPVGTIQGPATVYYGRGFGNFNDTFGAIPIANYFARMVGPPVMTLSDTAGHTGDASFFTTKPQPWAYGAQLANGWALCVGPASFFSSQTSFFVDVTFSDGVSTPIVKHVVIQNPAANYVTFYNQPIIINFDGNGNLVYNGNVVLDSQQADDGANVVVGTIYSSTGTLTFNDPSGLFSLNGTLVEIPKTSLIAANYGHYPVTVATTSPSGPTETIDLYIAHDYQPVVAYVSNGQLYSSQPVTNGFGSWPIGYWYAYTDTHGNQNSIMLQQLDILSDSSGALSLWNQGNGVYLKSPVSAGTINASFKASGISGRTTTMTLALPVTPGTTLSGSLAGTITPSLTNFIPYANTVNPIGSPKQVIALTQSGFTPDWTQTQIDLMDDGGAQVDNAQLTTTPGAPHTSFVLGSTPYVNDGGVVGANSYFSSGLAMTRYLLSGISGASANVVATNLSAIDHLTPKTDVVKITTTDGHGTFDTETFNLTINWCSNATSEIQVGPANANYPSPTFANPYAMHQAMWTDNNTNGQNATMACADVRLLRGVTAAALPSTNTGWNYSVTGSSYGGFWPYPVHVFGDTSTQATFTGDISNGSGGAGTILHLDSGVTGPGLFAGDMFTSGAAPVAATGTGSGSSYNLTISGSVTGAFQAGEFLAGTGVPAGTRIIYQRSGTGGGAGVYVTSNPTTVSGAVTATYGVMVGSNIDSTHWNVHIGPGATSTNALITATTMTTAMPRVVLDFGAVPGAVALTAPGPSQKGCLVGPAGGFDVELDNIEIANCSNAFANDGTGAFQPGGEGDAGAVWNYDQAHGNFALYKSYFRNSDQGVFNSGTGSHVVLDQDMFAKNGNNASTNHNIYVSISAAFYMTNSVSDDVWRVHDVKTRAQHNRFSRNIFADGINGLGSVPVEDTDGGDTIIDSNIILKTTNARVEYNSIAVQLSPEMALTPLAWPISNFVVSNNIIAAGTPQNNSWQPSIQAITAWGWNRTYATATYTDYIRNYPVTATATGNSFWHIQNGGPGNWLDGVAGGVVTDGGGNAATTTYPFTALELIDPVTGTPPINLPPVGALSCCQNPVSPYYNGSIASAPGTYGVSMVLPSGASPGTPVKNGLICAIGPDWNAFTGPPTYSFTNISTTNDNAKFTLTPSGNCAQVSNTGSIADGVYSVEIQGVGTGFNYGNSQPTTVNNVLSVVVGGYD